MKIWMRSYVRSAFCLLLASCVVTAAVATSVKPAEAGVVVSIGFGGGGYAPVYRPYPRQFAHVYHRRYVPAVWAPPRICPAYGYPAYGYPAYGPGYPVYGRPHRAGYARYGYDYGRGVDRGYYYGRGHEHRYSGRRYERNS